MMAVQIMGINQKLRAFNRDSTLAKLAVMKALQSTK
jgi:hypothetical protein